MVATKALDSPWRSGEARQQDRHAKKDAVLLTAARLFSAKGFQSTSLDDIAASLKVSKPTLYHYIDSKEQILFECVQRGLADLRAGIRAAAERGLQTRGSLRVAMENYAELVTSDFGMCVIRVGEDPLSDAKRHELRALKREIDAEFRTLIEQGMAEGWIVRGDAHVAAYTVVGALSGIGRWYLPERHGAQSLADAVQHCIEMLMRGVLGEPTADAKLARASEHASAAGPMAIRRETHFDNRIVRCFAERPASLAAMLERVVRERPHAEALVAGDIRLSWRELHHAARKCAGGLASRGVHAGDRVAVFLGNGTEFVITTLACAWLGAVLVPISARSRTPELAHALQDAEAAAIVCAADLLPLLPERASLPALRLVCSTGAAQAGVESFAALMQSAPHLEPHRAGEDELAVLLYTSGTTGKPKGAMLSHLNIVHSLMHYRAVMGLTADERSIVAVPLSHVTGLVAQLFVALHCGSCLVLMAQFKAADFVKLAAAEHMTHTIMVPAMYNLCLLQVDLAAHDLSAWRIGAFGGASMPTATIESMAAQLPGLTLINAYGATETCSPATIMPPGLTAAREDSVGLPVPCGEICIVDEAGRELPRGEIGEIWIAGPMVVRGYWRNEAATANEFCGGYWRSGDIGTQDAEGFVRILDRKKDVINRGGYKVYCAAVESVLAEHPEVIEAALIGVPCAVLGERVHAFVCVSALGEGTQAAALKAHCAARTSDYAVPETWTIGTEPLPRNANGKVMKRELRSTLHAALI